MSGWSVFWAGLKGLFWPGTSAFEEIAQLALDKVNKVLEQPVNAERVKKARDVLVKAHSVMVDYVDWCPAKWLAEFISIRSIVASVIGALDDGKLDLAEGKALVEKFKVAYAEWRT